jgi:hypothetical protein
MACLEELRLSTPSLPSREEIYKGWVQLAHTPLRVLHIEAPVLSAWALLIINLPQLTEFSFREHYILKHEDAPEHPMQARTGHLMAGISELCNNHRQQLRSFKLHVQYFAEDNDVEDFSELLNESIGHLPLLETFALTGTWWVRTRPAQEEGTSLVVFLRRHSQSLRSVELAQYRFGAFE